MGYDHKNISSSVNKNPKFILSFTFAGSSLLLFVVYSPTLSLFAYLPYLLLIYSQLFLHSFLNVLFIPASYSSGSSILLEVYSLAFPSQLFPPSRLVLYC